MGHKWCLFSFSTSRDRGQPRVPFCHRWEIAFVIWVPQNGVYLSSDVNFLNGHSAKHAIIIVIFVGFNILEQPFFLRFDYDLCMCLLVLIKEKRSLANPFNVPVLIAVWVHYRLSQSKWQILMYQRKFFHCFCKKECTKKAIKRIMTVGRTKYKKPVSKPNDIL